MQEIHYFQRYTQPENVATNNTLLLFSRLYHYSPYKFKAAIDELFTEQQLEAGIQFSQQQKGVSSVPDGMIVQKSFKIAIETKLHAHFSTSQLENHCKSFSDEKVKILVSLSPGLNKNSQKAREAVREFSSRNNVDIFYADLRFLDLIVCIRKILDASDYEFTAILDDYEEYCFTSDLIDESQIWMRAVVCGKSFEDNFNYNLYYDPIERGYSAHGYIGIYYNKAVRGIGKINNIVTADLISGKLQVKNSINPITNEQENRIIGAMNAAREREWDISSGHKFFLSDKIERTEYQKTSKYPLQRSKFFNLKEILSLQALPHDQDIAELLRNHEW